MDARGAVGVGKKEIDEGNLLSLSSHSVMSNSWQFHGLQHNRLPCPSPPPRACSNSCPLSWWCHPTICHPFLLYSIISSIRVISNESVLHIRWPKYWSLCFIISPSNEYPGLISFRIGRLDVCSPRDSRVLSNTIVQKHQLFSAQPSL